jgi:type I restriction enzyme S subunit
MMPVYAADLAGDLPEGWNISPFEELVHFQEGPGIRNWQYVEEGVPFVNIRCLVDGRLDRKAMSHVSKKEALGKYQHFLLEADDYVVSSSGTLGRIATVQPSDLPCMLNTSVIRMRPKTERLDRGYLKYFLLSEYYQAQILSFATGSAQLNYGPMHLRQMFIVSPPFAEQRAIAHILGTLDDKIELNRRMNETLEAIARALFKSWFVDFEPIHAKVEGRDPGLPKLLADLFPDSFEDSELGQIPRGWSSRPLYNTAIFINGEAFKSEDFCESGEGLPVIKIAELKDGIGAQTKYSHRAAEPSQRIDTGDILYSWSGSPDTSLDVFLWANGPGLLNQHIFKVVTTDPAHKRFAYYLFKYLRPVLVETARNKQTTGLGHVTVADMKRLHVCCPSSSILAAFDQQVAPLFCRAFANTLQSRTLAALRDTLLPKLISGELCVRDAERFRGRCA